MVSLEGNSMHQPHPELDVVVTQMRALESLFRSESADQPILAKDLLVICESIRTLACKIAEMQPAAVPEAVAS
jgi:hypothetical protein